jgi:hypothetical protein
MLVPSSLSRPHPHPLPLRRQHHRDANRSEPHPRRDLERVDVARSSFDAGGATEGGGDGVGVVDAAEDEVGRLTCEGQGGSAGRRESDGKRSRTEERWSESEDAIRLRETC